MVCRWNKNYYPFYIKNSVGWFCCQCKKYNCFWVHFYHSTIKAKYGNEVFCYFLLNTHSLMNNIFFFFFAFFLYLDIYGWILLAIAYVTMLSFDCVLKPITHSFNACESQHTSNSRYYVQRTLFRRVLACANFIQHKWLVDHSTSIATKAEFCWSEI